MASPSISFHVNLADPVGYACRLLRKAVGRGARVCVVAGQRELQALDAALWTFSAQDFIPHARAGSVPPSVLARTPVVLAPEAAAGAGCEVLVNLGPGAAAGFEAFPRVIELVGADAAGLQEGRDRWRHYAAHGHKPEKFDRKETVE